MEANIIGIVDNTMYLAPFFGGDHDHSVIITDYVKKDLIERGVSVFPNYTHIEAYLYGMSYEEFVAQQIIWDNIANSKNEEDAITPDLPF